MQHFFVVSPSRLKEAGRNWVLTEDLTHDRVFDGACVVDPLRAVPPG